MKPDQSLRGKVKEELLTASKRFDSFRNTIEETVRDMIVSYTFSYHAEKEKIYTDVDAETDIFEAALYPRTTGDWIDCLLFNDKKPSRFTLNIQRQTSSDLYRVTLKKTGEAFRNAYQHP